MIVGTRAGDPAWYVVVRASRGVNETDLTKLQFGVYMTRKGPWSPDDGEIEISEDLPTHIRVDLHVRICAGGDVVDRTNRVIIGPTRKQAEAIQSAVPGNREEPGRKISMPGIVLDLSRPDAVEDVSHHRFGFFPVSEDSPSDAQGVAGVPQVEALECSGLPSLEAPEQLGVGGCLRRCSAAATHQINSR